MRVKVFNNNINAVRQAQRLSMESRELRIKYTRHWHNKRIASQDNR